MFDPRRPKKIFRPERQVNKELKNYYHIDTYRNLSDSSFCLLCVDYQTLELLHSLKEPQYYARWIEDYKGRQVRISKPEDEQFVDRLWAKLQEQLADVACLTEVTEVLKKQADSVAELVAVVKYLTAAFTDGKVRDFYYDPGHPEDFAAKVGVAVEDLPAYDFNPTDGDIFHPNLSSFDSIGDSIITDPVTGTTWSTSRRMVEEVPSTFIYDGWTSDMGMAQLYVDTMYYNTGLASIPFTKNLTNNLERIDLVLRHIDAKFSRSGRLDLNLPDVPQLRHPITGERTELAKILDEAIQNGGNWLGYALPTVFAPGSPWPLLAYTKPSIFTVGAPRSDDPLGVNEESFNYDSHSAEILADGLLANWRPSIRLTEGMSPILTFPALEFDLPGNGGHISLPAIPLYAGSMDAVIPGDGGRGLAYLLKQEEEPVNLLTIDIPGIGVVKFRWDKNRLSVKVPQLTLPLGGSVPPWIAHMFTQRFISGFRFDEWTVIWPKPRGAVMALLRDYDIKLEGLGIGQLFKDILQVEEPNPLYDKNDPLNTEKKKIDGKTLAELFWIKEKKDKSDPTGAAKVGGYSFAELFWTEQQKESGEFGKWLPPLTFAELFSMKPDDPNYRSYLQTSAQIMNFMQIHLQQDLADLVQAIEDCCAANDMLGVQTALDTMADNMACLVLTQQAIYKIEGGEEEVDCVPTDPTVPRDCQAVAALVDELVNILDWLNWGAGMVGGTVAGPIVNAMVTFRWFTAILVAAGLVEPSPAEEVVTVPLGIIALLTYAVERIIELGSTFGGQMIQAIKTNRTDIINLLCGATDTDIETKIDDAISLVKDAFADAGVRAIVQDLLENYLKSPAVQGVILTK